MEQFKFRKGRDEDERTVFLGDEYIGLIYRVWLRLGGWGWSHSVSADAHSCKTMKEAAYRLQRKLKERTV